MLQRGPHVLSNAYDGSITHREHIKYNYNVQYNIGILHHVFSVRYV